MLQLDQTCIERTEASRLLTRRGCQLLGLWALVAIGHFAIRNCTIPVWDDTTIIAHAQFDDGFRTLEAVYAEAGWPGVIQRAFSGFSSAGYRPLVILQRAFYIGLSEASPSELAADIKFGYTLGGVSLGLLAVCLFFVARRFTETDAGAFFAIFLLLFSPPVVAGAWLSLFNIQAVVPLLIGLGLLLYWRVVERRALHGFAAAALGLLMLVGPWYREFVGVLPVLILVLEWQRRRRPTWMGALALLGLLHALFPTALIKWTLFPEMPVRSIFAMGHLHHAISQTARSGAEASWLVRQWTGIKWHAPWNFLVLLPPMLLGLAYLGLLVDVSAQLFASRSSAPMQAAEGREHRRGARLWLVATIAFPIGAFLVWSVSVDGLGLWLALGVAVIALRWNAFLAVWFLLSFLPFLKAYTEQVHFGYAMVPASIVVALAVERLLRRCSEAPSLRPTLRWMAAVVLLVAVGDHALNLYGSFRVVTSMNDGMARMADWLRANTSKDSVVICNALHAEDIRWMSEGHFTAYWTVEAGVAHWGRSLETADELESFLKKNAGRRDVYFLDVDYEFTPDKVGYHAHRYVHGRSVAMEDLGRVHVTRAQYPFLDPLKAFIPRRYISFLGAPDLVNDVYRGPARDDRLLHNEVYAEYRVYKVTGTQVTEPWTPIGPLELAREGYHGFNILKCNGRYLGLLQSAGPVDFNTLRHNCYSGCLLGASLAEVERLIDREIESHPQGVELLEEGFQGFNIIRCGGRLFGLAQDDGAFDIEKVRLKQYSHCFEGSSIDELRQKIAQSKPRPGRIALLVEGYRGFNLVGCGDRVYGVGQEEGEFKIEKVRQNGYRRLVRGESVDDAKRRIDDHLRVAEREKEQE